MDHPVHAGVCIGVVLEQIVPASYRELGNNKRGMKAITAIDYFKEVPAFVDIKLHEPEIINDQKI